MADVILFELKLGAINAINLRLHNEICKFAF